MKTAKNKLITYLFYPYQSVDGWKAISWGLGIQLLATLLAYFMSGRFDGFLDYHLVDNATLYQTAFDQLINVSTMLLVFGATIALISRGRNRGSDLIGLLLIARAPVVVLPLLNIGDFFRQLTPRLLADEMALSKLPSPAESFILLLFSLLALSILVWWLVMLFQVYRLLLHKTGFGYTLLFLGLVVLAEYISKSLILLLNV